VSVISVAVSQRPNQINCRHTMNKDPSDYITNILFLRVRSTDKTYNKNME